MFRISKDSPVYYLTSVTNTRLPVFRTSKLKDLLCEALDEARKSAQFLIFAYVIMTDHFHALIGSERKPSEITRYVNGISSRRVINYLKEAGHESSLQKLRHATGVRGHKYSLLGPSLESEVSYNREWSKGKGKLHSPESSSGWIDRGRS